MGSYGFLCVDGIEVSAIKNGMPSELLALFTDNMLRRRETRAADHYSDASLGDESVQVHELVASGRVIADRLEVFGFPSALALVWLDKELEKRWATIASISARSPDTQAPMQSVLDYLDGYTAQDWLCDLASAWGHPDRGDRLVPGSRDWLLSLIEDWEVRTVLRAVLLALPDAEVRLDLTDLVQGGWLDDRAGELCSEALASMRADAATNAPIIVLTEGRTDIQVLQPALDLLFPHLADLIRFMDYAERPEGGAGALVRTVRAFAAAGVANRVVALFDNDTAATDALRNLDIVELPANIRVLRYPRLDLAADYPTFGPPTADAPSGRLANADVNGLAGAIELYLGRDVLTGRDGALRPVQWRAYIPSMGQYQGEIVDKEALHAAYRVKVDAARRNHARMAEQDWSGVQAILELICGTFVDPTCDHGVPEVSGDRPPRLDDGAPSAGTHAYPSAVRSAKKEIGKAHR